MAGLLCTLRAPSCSFASPPRPSAPPCVWSPGAGRRCKVVHRSGLALSSSPAPRRAARAPAAKGRCEPYWLPLYTAAATSQCRASHLALLPPRPCLHRHSTSTQQSSAAATASCVMRPRVQLLCVRVGTAGEVPRGSALRVPRPLRCTTTRRRGSACARDVQRWLETGTRCVKRPLWTTSCLVALSQKYFIDSLYIYIFRSRILYSIYGCVCVVKK